MPTAVSTAAWPTWTATVEAAATATLPGLALAGDINDDRTALNVCAVEHVYCSLSLVLARHLDETETTLAAGRRIKNYAGRHDIPRRCKHLR